MMVDLFRDLFIDVDDNEFVEKVEQDFIDFIVQVSSELDMDEAGEEGIDNEQGLDELFLSDNVESGDMDWGTFLRFFAIRHACTKNSHMELFIKEVTTRITGNPTESSINAILFTKKNQKLPLLGGTDYSIVLVVGGEPKK
ncbi:hypothetical protein DERP_008645 [Dermatophagoides pteronyssinus]|uniref:Uncharacterized protein n=1 Tax=Dermatophagoides pteronyssinus TaxID=6956 RepID=A0ABQ8IWY8_DERPT|nr:hypothetical protein DERP_008645 [Dermatophagoides pteronyssinus]